MKISDVKTNSHCKLSSRDIVFKVKKDQGRGEQSENDKGPREVICPIYCICNST